MFYWESGERGSARGKERKGGGRVGRWKRLFGGMEKGVEEEMKRRNKGGMKYGMRRS